MANEYITDGIDMYDVVYERDVVNYGRLGGTLHVFVVRNCKTDICHRMGACHRALCYSVTE